MKRSIFRVTAAAGTLALVALVVGVGAGPASAHQPTVTPTCSELDVNLTSYTDPTNTQPNTVWVEIDGADVEGTQAAPTSFGTTFTQSYTFSSSTVAHSYKVVVDAWDDQPIDVNGNGPLGYSVTSSGSSTPCVAPPTVAACTSPIQVVPSTNLAVNGWDYSDTRANGHYSYVPGALSISTDGTSDTGPRTDGIAGTWNTDKSTGYHDLNVPLAQLGSASMDYTLTSGSLVGINLKFDKDGDGTVDSNLVYEEGMGGNPSNLDGTGGWWATQPGLGTISATPIPNPSYQHAWGTLDQYLAAWPNAVITAVGFSLGSGAQGAGQINSITAGCKQFTFDYVAPVTSPSASIATGVCTVDTNGNFNQRHVSITDDNSGSNVPVLFSVEYTGNAYDQTVAAGAVVTFPVADIWPAGGGYTVDANGSKLPFLSIDPCPIMPTGTPTVTPVSTTDCTTSLVTTVTTTSTPTFVFDPATQLWGNGSPIVTTATTTAPTTLTECPVQLSMKTLASTGANVLLGVVGSTIVGGVAVGIVLAILGYGRRRRAAE